MRPTVLILFLLGLLAGCASTKSQLSALPSPPFADANFAPPSEPISSAGLFALSPAMQAYLKSPAFSAHLRNNGLEHGLVDALYSKTDLLLDYDSSKTRTAAETYAARAGNCLSLVIMTAAFAKELGMTVRYQAVDVDESWSRSGSLYLANSHVNIVLGHRARTFYDSSADHELLVDFLPSEAAARLHARRLDEEQIVALFMNNRAVETLEQGHLDDAYWWARAAVAKHPASATAFNTLGVVYQRHGDLALAEQAYRASLAREPDNVVAMQNLGPMLDTMGRHAEAQELARRVAQIQPLRPFEDFDQGVLAMKRGDYGAARDMFEREVKRDPYYDEFHFWLAQALLRLGEAKQAREQLAMAVDTSTQPDTRLLYSSKLSRLRQLAGAPRIQ